MSKKKKIIVLSGMIVLLAVVAVFNFVLATSSTKEESTVTTTASFFSQYKTERLSSRNQEIVYLDSIIAESEDNSETKTNALNQKQKIVEAMGMEMQLETLLAAQGFENIAVSVGLTSTNINVMVENNELTKADTARIYSTIFTETGASAEQVKIISIS